MRRDARQSRNVGLANISSYHHSQEDNGKAYFFASDRPVEIKFSHTDRFGQSIYTQMNGKPFKGYGLEIETECSGIKGNDIYATVLRDIVLKPFHEKFFRCENDGSLGGGRIDTLNVEASAEIISAVLSKEAIRNNYPNFKLMFDTYFKLFHISASATGHCGMHVNVSNACFGGEKHRLDAIRKMFYFINSPKLTDNFIKVLFMRNESADDYYYSRWECPNMEYAKNLNPNDLSYAHAKAINFQHYNDGRVELRIVGGQEDFKTFQNTMEVIFFLVGRLKDVPWDKMDDLTYIFKGCNKHVSSRLKRCVRHGELDIETWRTINTNREDVDFRLS